MSDHEDAINSLNSARAEIQSVAGTLTLYKTLSDKYGKVLKELQTDVEAVLGRLLLARLDASEPVTLTRGVKVRSA